MACLQLGRSGFLPMIHPRSGFFQRHRSQALSLPVRCCLQEGVGDNGEEPQESLFMKELKRRGMNSTSLLKDAERASYSVPGQEDMESKAENGGGRQRTKRNGVASAEYEKGATGQRERSMALNSVGIEVFGSSTRSAIIRGYLSDYRGYGEVLNWLWVPFKKSYRFTKVVGSIPALIFRAFMATMVLFSVAYQSLLTSNNNGCIEEDLNCNGRMGLIPRAKLLLTLGGTFFLGFWPLFLITFSAFAALYLYFGSGFVHDASKAPVTLAPYVDPYELLEDERISQIAGNVE